MKKKIVPATLIGLLAFSSGLVALNNQNYQKVDAYSIATLPTTIDLNDCNETEIRNYYSNLNSLSESERQGTNLLKNLKPILAKNQKYYSYDSNTKIWQMYEISDRDWEKSPANGTTYGTYDSVTNKITGYQYGSNSDVKNNPYIHALYNNRELDNEAKAWGNHNQDGWGINQEHIWAKSHGFDTKGSDSSGGARGDPMHLWAGNGWANHEHSNYFFAYVDKGRSYSDAGTKYNTAWGNLTGYSLNVGGSETVFEPQDSDKGDIARSIFYMAARYNYYSGSDSAPIDGNNPNLVLLNNLSENNKTGTSNATTPFGMGLLSDLLAWNRLDPVDEYETHRNNLLYKNYTNNRNPFIDFPEWAEYIWGTADLDGKNYNPTAKKAANPSTDTVGDFSADKEPFVVSADSLELKVGGAGEIYAQNADDDISWTIDDDTVVNLNKYTSHNDEVLIVSGLKKGETTIHASAYNNGDLVNKSISVKVNETAVVTLKKITVNGAKTEFQVGDTFSTDGLTVTAHYSDGTTKVITEGYTVSSPDMSLEGNQTVTVTYEGLTATYEINVKKAPAPKPTIKKLSVQGAKTDFEVGDTFSTDGLTVTAEYSDGTTKVITEGYTISAPDMSLEGKQTITITYEGLTATYEINIVKGSIANLEPPYKLLFIAGGIALVLIIVVIIIIYVNVSKKGKKKMNSMAKKGIKKVINNSSKKK